LVVRTGWRKMAGSAPKAGKAATARLRQVAARTE